MNREEWLKMAQEQLDEIIREASASPAEKVRIACGFPSSGGLARKRRKIGECWSDSASEDGYFEIFISPIENNPFQIVATLLHELIHSAVGTKCGHRGAFLRTGKMVGFMTPITTSKPSEGLTDHLNAIVKKLPEYPHGALNHKTKKRQTTRMIKLECPGCKYVVRTTQKWIETGLPTCVCGEEFERKENNEIDN